MRDMHMKSNQILHNAVIGLHPGDEAWVTENSTIEVNGKKYNLTLQNGLILYKRVTESTPSNSERIPVTITDIVLQEQEDRNYIPSSIQIDKDLAFGLALSGAAVFLTFLSINSPMAVIVLPALVATIFSTHVGNVIENKLEEDIKQSDVNNKYIVDPQNY